MLASGVTIYQKTRLEFSPVDTVRTYESIFEPADGPSLLAALGALDAKGHGLRLILLNPRRIFSSADPEGEGPRVKAPSGFLR